MARMRRLVLCRPVPFRRVMSRLVSFRLVSSRFVAAAGRDFVLSRAFTEPRFTGTLSVCRQSLIGRAISKAPFRYGVIAALAVVRRERQNFAALIFIT